MNASRLVAIAILLAGLSLWSLPAPAQAGVSAVDHRISVRLDPAGRAIEVSDLMRIRGGGEVRIRLAESMVVTGVSVDGRPVARSRQGEFLRLDLGAAGEHQVGLQYRGLLSPLSERSGELDAPLMMASERGSYLSSGSAWHPVVGGVAATYRLTLTLPMPQKAVVPGRLIEESTADGQYRAVFQSDVPSQGIVLIAGPFTVDERRHGDIVLRTYFTPGLEDVSPGYLQSTAEYLDMYEKRIGEYPFSSFFIVSGPLPVGLGFAGMTYIGERVLRLPFIRFTSLGHEVLHNWWGNGVGVDYENGNWAEGLTTFMADYAFAARNDGAGDGQKQMRTEWLRDYSALPPVRDRPVKSFISRRHTASRIIGYNKVAYIFHMLERKIGAAAFDRGIRDFWRDHKLAAAGWRDIRESFEQASKQDLSVFFSQWLDRSGAPRLVLSDVRVNDASLSFTLSQDGPPYSLEVPVRLVGGDGEEFFQAAIEGPASRVELPLSGRPLSLSIDPDFDIFRRLDGAETPPILRETTLDSDSLVVVAGRDGEMEQTARLLASRMMDVPARFAGPAQAAGHRGPVLIIGATGAVARVLAANGLPSTPDALAGRGSARVWAGRRPDGRPLLVVEANDNRAMASLLGPLPHYGRRGYLVFDGAKVVERGAWPTGAGPLAVTFD